MKFNTNKAWEDVDLTSSLFLCESFGLNTLYLHCQPVKCYPKQWKPDFHEQYNNMLTIISKLPCCPDEIIIKHKSILMTTAMLCPGLYWYLKWKITSNQLSWWLQSPCGWCFKIYTQEVVWKISLKIWREDWNIYALTIDHRSGFDWWSMKIC